MFDVIYLFDLLEAARVHIEDACFGFVACVGVGVFAGGLFEADLLGIEEIPVFIDFIMVCVQAFLAEITEGVLADMALSTIIEHHVLRACQLTACCLPYNHNSKIFTQAYS